MHEVQHSFKYVFGPWPENNIDLDYFSINHTERLSTWFWGESYK